MHIQTKYARLSMAIVLTLCTAQAKAEELPQLIERLTPFVVTVSTQGSLGQRLGHGSGFFITDDHIVTNYHVVEGASAASVTLSDGRVFNIVGLVADDRAGDVAILKIDGEVQFSEPVAVRTQLPSVGESVIVIGTPIDEALTHTVSEGIVSGVRRGFGGFPQLIQITAPVSPGNSGGPLFDSAGNVIGIVTFKSVRGQSLNFAVPASRFSALDVGAPKPLGAIIPILSTSPPDVPEAFLDYVSPTHRRLLERESKHYLMLPNGAVLHAYRLMRVRELLANTSSSLRDNELEALGYEYSSTSSYEVEYERVPPWVIEPDLSDAIGFWKIHLSSISDSRAVDHAKISTGENSGVRIKNAIGSQYLLVSLAGMEFLLRTADNHSIASVLQGDFLLAEAGVIDIDGKSRMVVECVPLDQAIPTPAQLAFAVASGKGNICLHRHSRSRHQPTETNWIKTGWNSGVPVTRNTGPPVVSHRWRTTEVDIHFRDVEQFMPDSKDD